MPFVAPLFSVLQLPQIEYGWTQIFILRRVPGCMTDSVAMFTFAGLELRNCLVQGCSGATATGNGRRRDSMGSACGHVSVPEAGCIRCFHHMSTNPKHFPNFTYQKQHHTYTNTEEGASQNWGLSG